MNMIIFNEYILLIKVIISRKTKFLNFKKYVTTQQRKDLKNNLSN